MLLSWISAVVTSLAIGCAIGSPAFARNVFSPSPGELNETPPELQDVKITPPLGENVNLDLQFRDESGKVVSLREFVQDGKPALLSLAYFGCPSLCSTHITGLVDSFKAMKKPVGEEFKFILVSIEPKETPQIATEKKNAYLKAYGQPQTSGAWHFLTGDEAAIRALAQQVGFKYHWDENQKQYAHASGAFVLTPEGKLSRYFPGVVFDPKNLRLALIEASNGTVGTLVDKLTLFCFHLDLRTNKRSLAAFNVVRAGGALMIVIMGAFLVPFWFAQNQKRKQKRRLQGDA